MRKKIGVGVILLLCTSVLLGACGTKNEKEVKKEPKKEVKKEILKNIGTEAEGENIFKVTLENGTGKNIVGIAIKDSSMTEYPANMLAESDVFAAGEKRKLYYDATNALQATQNQTTDENTNVLPPQMDVQLVFDDQTSMVLSAFPFEDVKEAKICLEDVAYIEYKSLASKEMLSTKEAELTIKAEAEAAAKAQAEAEAAAQAQAEAEAAAKAQAEAEAAERARQEAAAAEKARKEAEAAKARQQKEAAQKSQQQSSGSSDGCMNGALVY